MAKFRGKNVLRRRKNRILPLQRRENVKEEKRDRAGNVNPKIVGSIPAKIA